MAFTINTNVSSLQAQNYLRTNSDFQSKTISRVTSGLRIVQSGDDAAGLAIANGFRSDEAVLAQGVRNANDGLSQLQIIDGGISNISQLLDRARTLATQSASGTFTGDRSVLNNEFQSVLTEIDRQAQSIGLNQGGVFAKNLSVFIGGGKASATQTALQNGAVSLDLSTSTVDTQGLGLKGVQAQSHGNIDATSLASILANTTNQGSLAAPGTTVFYLKGPGFNATPVTVNTTGLAGTSDLVNAINSAITAAGSSGTASATALKNAQITASVVTDSSGKQKLAFSSSTAAFQVEAGDRVSNALLGNTEQNAVVETNTSATSATVDTTGGNNVLHFVFDGDTTAAGTFDVNLTAGAATAKGSIVNQLNGNSSFNARGIAYLDGNRIVVKSFKNDTTSSIAVTGTAATNVGFTGAGFTSATAASSSTGADLSTRFASQGPAGSNAIRSASNAATASLTSGTDDALNITIGATTANLTLGTFSGTKQQLADVINRAIAATHGAGSDISGKVTASVDSNSYLVLTAADPSQTFSIAGTSTTAGTKLFDATNRPDPNVFGTAANITLRFQGGGLSSPVDLALTPTVAGTTSLSTVLSDLKTKVAANTTLAAAGITVTSNTAGNNIVFTSTNGQQFTVTSSGDVENKLGLGSFKKDAGLNVDYSTITATAAYSRASGSGAVITNGPSATSTLEVSLAGGAAQKLSVDLTSGDATSGAITGSGSILPSVALAAGHTILVNVDGAQKTVTLTGGAPETAATILSDFNAGLGASATATLDSTGRLIITSATKGADSSVQILAGGTASNAEISALGLPAAGTAASTGQNASKANVINQLNTAIAQNTQLSQAGLQAGLDSTGNNLVLSSNNGTKFQLNSYGTDIGFGVTGATFATGNTQGPAPKIAPTVDSGGADATSALSFTGIKYGTDTQNLNITASDSNGHQSIGISLNNTNARTIDEAVSTINSQLQNSTSALKNVIAVKEENGSGAESIVFLSTDKAFKVSVGSTSGGTGFTPPAGNVTTSATTAGGTTASILDQSSAQNAVAALAISVSTLGSAQAVVGKGQNQFSYAVNLAQSQLTNLSAAESRIRDADLAAESANLTKAQVLLQAGIAALAQANSAPQQVLSLLRG